MNEIEKHFWKPIDRPNLNPEWAIAKFLKLSQLVGIDCDSENVLKKLKTLSFKIDPPQGMESKDKVLFISRYLFNENNFELNLSGDIRGFFIEKTLKEKKGHPLCLALIFKLLCHWHDESVEIIELADKILIKPTGTNDKSLYIDLCSPQDYLSETQVLSLLNQAQKEKLSFKELDYSQIFLLALDVFEKHFEQKKLLKLLLLTLNIKTQIKPSDIISLQKKIRLNQDFLRLSEVRKDLKKLSFISEFHQWHSDIQSIYLKSQKENDSTRVEGPTQ